MASLHNLYLNHGIDTKQLKQIHVWCGPRTIANKKIRSINKSCYDSIIAEEVMFVSDTRENPDQYKATAYGSYNLFHPTSLEFHLIYEGDYTNQDFIEAILGYCTVEDVALPRIYGKGAMPLDKRIPIVIIVDSEYTVAPELRPYASLIKITN